MMTWCTEVLGPRLLKTHLIGSEAKMELKSVRENSDLDFNNAASHISGGQAG